MSGETIVSKIQDEKLPLKEVSASAKNNHEKRMVALAIGASYLKNPNFIEGDEEALKILHQLGGNSKKIRALEAAIKNHKNRNHEETAADKKDEISKAMSDLLLRAQSKSSPEEELFLVKLVQTPEAINFNQGVLDFLSNAVKASDHRKAVIGSAALSIAIFYDKNSQTNLQLPKDLEKNLNTTLNTLSTPLPKDNSEKGVGDYLHIANILRAVLATNKLEAKTQDQSGTTESKTAKNEIDFTSSVDSALRFLLDKPFEKTGMTYGDLESMPTNVARGISYAFQINPDILLSEEGEGKVVNTLLKAREVAGETGYKEAKNAVEAAISNVSRVNKAIGDIFKKREEESPEPTVQNPFINDLIDPPKAFR